MLRRLSSQGIRTTTPSASVWLQVLIFEFVCLFACSGLAAQTVLVGNQTIESNIDSNAKGVAEAFPATASASGQVGSINVYLDPTSVATKVYMGIYADSSGHPGTLLTQGSITQFSLGAWNNVPVTPVNITSGTKYEADVIELDQQGVRFTHPLLASTLYAEASPERRRQLHRRLAAASADPEEKARHLALAANGPDATVASALDHAATAARARGATDVAALLTEQARQLTPPAQSAERWRRTMKAVEYAYEAGDSIRALQLGRRRSRCSR